MEILWASGEANVREVAGRLGRSRAYTTVMTTLDRLFKKGLLARRRAERCFLYAPRLSQPDWERMQARELAALFLASRETTREQLFSSLLDAAEPLDVVQLGRLEAQIRRRRKQLARGGQP